jgi:hypothetical protein
MAVYREAVAWVSRIISIGRGGHGLGDPIADASGDPSAPPFPAGATFASFVPPACFVLRRASAARLLLLLGDNAVLDLVVCRLRDDAA